MHSELIRLLQTQDGVVARRQLVALGLLPHEIRRMLRRRHLNLVHPGVYVDHTGPLIWQQRAWAAVLYAWPAVLAGQSAIRAWAGPGWPGVDDEAPIDVAIDERRTVRALPGVTVRRVAAVRQRTHRGYPPRLKLEEATLDVALAAPDEFAAYEVLAACVRARRTTADRLLAALAGRERVTGSGSVTRKWLQAALADIRDGTCSVLERGYLELVERAHGLPRPLRQGVAPGRRRAYRDVEYASLGVVIELDGRAFHDNSRQRDLDLDRDLDSLLGDAMTLRLGWGQVFRRPCETAAKVATLLQRRGWRGEPETCGSDCKLKSTSARFGVTG